MAAKIGNQNAKGMKHTFEWKKAMSLRMKGNNFAKGMKPNKTSFKKGEHNGIKTEFEKGFVPWNKGTKGVMKAWNKGKPNFFARGDKSNFWKGGISKQNRTERMNVMNTLEYVNWRRIIFLRDNFVCQICGLLGGKLRANHIKKYRDYPNLRTYINNGITICEKCDLSLVMGEEKEWESYFNFNLETRKDGGIYG